MAAPYSPDNGSFASGLYTEILAASRGEGHAISRALLQKVMIVTEVFADFLTCAGGVSAVCFLYPSLHTGQVVAISVVAGLLMVWLLERDGGYRAGGGLLQIRATEHALRIPAQALLLLLLCNFFFHRNVPYTAFLVALILLPLLLIFEKQMLFAITRILRSCQCKLLIAALSRPSPEKLTATVQAEKQAGLEIALLVDPALEVRPWTEWIDLGGGLLVTSTVDPIAPFHYAVAKRTVDVIASSLLLLLLAPVLFLIALLVWLNSPGPILFVHKRVGRNGELFDMYKFRSMHATAPRYGLSPTQSSDTRITAVGRFLRRSSLDELPQLINVFLGDMSLVGPRPEMPFVVQGYDSRQRQRLQVVPGITGLWQLSAARAFPIHDNIEFDLSYIQNRSFFMDMAILLHTPFRALRGGI